jgi:signal peptidase I
MQGNLFEGERIIVNKLAYGARVPMTPLSIGSSYLGLIKIPYVRLPGFSDFKRNDLIVFNFSLSDEDPIDIREEIISRIIALPGDSLLIKNGIAEVNSQISEPANIFLPYTIVSTAGIDSNLNIVPNKEIQPTTYNYFTSTEKAADLLKTGSVRSVSVNILSKDESQQFIFPNNNNYKWNVDHFGPLWIPREGDSIALTSKNIILYKSTMERFEKAIIKVKGDSVFVNDRFASHYIFEQNYFFVMGDNRHNVIDSRTWGFIPESHIIGKVSVILYSPREGRSLSRVK